MDSAHAADSDAGDYEARASRSFKRRRGPQGEPLEGLLTLTRQMETDEEDQFDVDLTIFDFLAFRATDLVFEWRASSDPHESDLPDALVTMTSDWRKVLEHKHSGKRVNSQTAFRSRLLKFALLFTHRFNHENTWTNKESLNGLRAQNKSRGSYWRQNTAHAPALQQPFDTNNEFPLSDGALAENRNNLASGLDTPPERRRWVTDIEGTPSLHCLLPLFMELTASRIDLGDFVPTAEWYNLAGLFMLQAVIEDYLRNGAFGDEPFNTIFAFGCPGTEPTEDEADDVSIMRKLFCAESSPHEQIHGWARIKRQYINELLPSSNSSVTFLQAIESAQKRHPYLIFEASLIEFLKYLHDDLVKPDLVQVEEGRITIHGNELPEPESREMIRRMGL